MPKLKDHTGTIYGQFKVVQDLGTRFATSKSKQRVKYVLVECKKCLHKFEILYSSFKYLSSSRCKQFHKANILNPVSKEWTRIRHIHRKMLQRCHNKEDSSYERYGGLGIKVCDEWRSSLKTFYDWSIKNGYKNNLTIDRINSNLGYEPRNCRWATRKQQARNKRCVISIGKVKEIKKLLKEGYVNRVIADIVCTSKSRVDDISSGKTWKDI